MTFSNTWRGRRPLALLRSALLLLGVGRALAVSNVCAADQNPSPPALLPSSPEPTAPGPTQLEAMEHHRLGLALYDRGEYERALGEFARSYALSQNYQLLFNISQLQYQLGHFASARRGLESYLERGGPRIPRARAEAVRRQLDELQQRTAVLVLVLDGSNTELEIQTEHRTTTAGRERVIVDPGEVPLIARRPGFAAVRRSVWLAAGSRAELTIEFDRPLPVSLSTQRSRLGEALLWTSAGVFAAGALGTGLATVLTARRYDQLRAEPEQGSADSIRDRLDRQRALVRHLAFTTDALALAGLAATGIALYVRVSAPEAPPAEALTLRLEPDGLVVRGSF